MSTLIQHLNDADLNVQLKHIPTETSWTDEVDHGYIAIIDADGGQLLRRDGFQHNRKLRNGGARDPSAIAAIVKEVLDAANAKPMQLAKDTIKVVETEAGEANTGAPAA